MYSTNGCNNNITARITGTDDAHRGLWEGDVVKLIKVGGMTELEDGVFAVVNVRGTHAFEIDVDISDFPPYTGSPHKHKRKRTMQSEKNRTVLLITVVILSTQCDMMFVAIAVDIDVYFYFCCSALTFLAEQQLLLLLLMMLMSILLFCCWHVLIMVLLYLMKVREDHHTHIHFKTLIFFRFAQTYHLQLHQLLQVVHMQFR